MTEKEFRAYFRELYPQLGRYATKLLGDADVDDVLQVAFLELWNRRTDINTAAHVRAFMFRSVYTQALNVLKRGHLCLIKTCCDSRCGAKRRRRARCWA